MKSHDCTHSFNAALFGMGGPQLDGHNFDKSPSKVKPLWTNILPMGKKKTTLAIDILYQNVLTMTVRFFSRKKIGFQNMNLDLP